MKYRLFLPVLLCGAVLLALSACSDPAGVGANLGADSLDEGTPQSLEIEPSLLDTTSAAPETGFNSTSAPRSRSWRFLAGAVKDPIAGIINAEGHVDFLGAASRPSSIREATEDELNAELRLEPTYLHGDTSSALKVHLFTLKSEAKDMHRAPADTFFTPGTQLSPPSGISITPTDSLVTLPLPESWIRDHLAPLQDDTTFEDKINGFKIVAANENPTGAARQVVAGFDHTNATLRLRTDTTETTADTTVDFSALKSFTRVERDGAPEVPLDDWTLLQDGAGINLLMNWNFGDPPLDSLKNTPLNQADITIPIDEAKMRNVTSAQTSDQFVRPSPNSYRVLATQASNTPSCRQIGLPALPREEEACILPTRPSSAPGIARVASETAYTIFDRALFETQPFTRYRVEIAVQEDPTRQNALRRGLPSTLPVLVRTANDDVTNRPHATLIVTPL